MTEKVTIIGSGPAGLTAAIYCARAMMEPLVLMGDTSGGQLTTTTDVENYPGFPDAIAGMLLTEQMKEQASKFGAKLFHRSVTDVDLSQRPFRIHLCNGMDIATESLIIATGAQSLWLNLPKEEELRGRGISTCAVCDGSFFIGEDLIVIGGGDSAMEEAVFLTRYARSVTVVHRRDTFKASKIMLDRARKNTKIKWQLNSTVKEWLSTDGFLSGAVLDTPEGDKIIHCAGAFIAIGHLPNTSFLKGQVSVDADGYINLISNTMTSVTGVFACGDVTDRRYKQAITAAGQGCQSAIDVEKWLEENSI
jgi:thioredoxin reductase (NADPH)